MSRIEVGIDQKSATLMKSPKPGLIISTLYISPDEPCYELSETNLQQPDGRGFHRYRVSYINRYDKLISFWEDLGPAENYAGVDQFRIPGGVHDELTGKYMILHSVGELRDIADWVRNLKSMSNQIEPRDLIGGYWQHEEAKAYNRKSTYGSKYHKQRD